jgi:acetyl esterase/lipase
MKEVMKVNAKPKKKRKIVLRVLLYLLIAIIALFAVFIVDTIRYMDNIKIMKAENWGWPDSNIEPTYKDLQYGSYNGEALLLDIYIPDQVTLREETYPLVIVTHGGGWQVGSKEVFEPGVYYLLKHGYAIASVNYTYSTEAKWPVQGEQVKGAVRWLRANADAYDLDTNRFASFGGSAGGQLSSFLGTTNGLKQYDSETHGNMDYSSEVQAAVAWYAPNDFFLDYEFSFLNLFFLDGNKANPNSGFGVLLGGSVNKNTELAKDASPYYHISPETTVPFLLMHGAADRIVPPGHSIEFDEKLKSLGIRSDLYVYEGYLHADMRFMSDENMDNVLLFLNDVLDVS